MVTIVTSTVKASARSLGNWFDTCTIAHHLWAKSSVLRGVCRLPMCSVQLQNAENCTFHLIECWWLGCGCHSFPDIDCVNCSWKSTRYHHIIAIMVSIVTHSRGKKYAPPPASHPASIVIFSVSQLIFLCRPFSTSTQNDWNVTTAVAIWNGRMKKFSLFSFKWAVRNRWPHMCAATTCQCQIGRTVCLQRPRLIFKWIISN